MSATDNTIAPVIETPPKDQTLTETPVQSAPVNATTTAIATGVNATGPKVTPVQRLSSVYKKAKQTVTEAVTEAQKALHEKKSTQTNEATTEREAADVTTETAAEKKVASGPLKDLLDRVKGLSKPASSHGTTTTDAPTDQLATDESTAPVPPPKDNVKSSASNTNPILDQLKRNSTLLSNYFLQKKKEFTEKRSSETNNNEQSQLAPEQVHANDTQPAAAAQEKAPASPLVRRITQLVHTATTTITKKKDQLKKQDQTNNEASATVDHTTTESPTAVGGTA